MSGAHSHRCGELQGSLEQVEGWRCLDKGPTGLCGEPPSFPEVVAGPCTPPPPSSQGPCMARSTRYRALGIFPSFFAGCRSRPAPQPQSACHENAHHSSFSASPLRSAAVPWRRSEPSPGGPGVSWHTLGREEQGENRAAGQTPGQLGCEAPCPTSAEQACRTSTPGQLTCTPLTPEADDGPSPADAQPRQWPAAAPYSDEIAPPSRHSVGAGG